MNRESPVLVIGSERSKTAHFLHSGEPILNTEYSTNLDAQDPVGELVENGERPSVVFADYETVRGLAVPTNDDHRIMVPQLDAARNRGIPIVLCAQTYCTKAPVKLQEGEPVHHMLYVCPDQPIKVEGIYPGINPFFAATHLSVDALVEMSARESSTSITQCVLNASSLAPRIPEIARSGFHAIITGGKATGKTVTSEVLLRNYDISRTLNMYPVLRVKTRKLRSGEARESFDQVLARIDIEWPRSGIDIFVENAEFSAGRKRGRIQFPYGIGIPGTDDEPGHYMNMGSLVPPPNVNTLYVARPIGVYPEFFHELDTQHEDLKASFFAPFDLDPEISVLENNALEKSYLRSLFTSGARLRVFDLYASMGTSIGEEASRLLHREGEMRTHDDSLFDFRGKREGWSTRLSLKLGSNYRPIYSGNRSPIGGQLPSVTRANGILECSRDILRQMSDTQLLANVES